MKTKSLIVLLFLCSLCLAQTASQSTPAQPDAKASCPMMSKDAKSCCHHKSVANDEKQKMSCCEGKDGMPCMKDGGKSAESAAPNCCQGKDHKACCGKCEKASGEAAMACCEKGGHCGMNHESADLGK